MKKIVLLSIACLFFSKAFAEYSFTIEPQGYFEYRLYCNSLAHTSVAGATANFEHFQLESNSPNVPKIIYKPSAVVRTYSFEDSEGDYIEGSATIFSLGAFLDRMKEITVYNQNKGVYIGSFSGIWDTENIAEFIFYNIYTRPIAIATIDKERKTIPIMDIENQGTQIALFEKHHNRFRDGSVEYYWEMKVQDDVAIPPELLQIFAAFVTDIYFAPIPSLFTGFHLGL